MWLQTTSGKQKSNRKMADKWTPDLPSSLVCKYCRSGADPGGGDPPPAPLNWKKIWFVIVKSWFFTRNSPNMFAPPSARRALFLSAPPPLTWNPGSAPTKSIHFIQFSFIAIYISMSFPSWVRARLCKLQNRVHSTCSRKLASLPVTYPWSVVLSWYSGFVFHWNWSPWYSWNIAESDVEHQKSINQCFCFIETNIAPLCSATIDVNNISVNWKNKKQKTKQRKKNETKWNICIIIN